MTTNNKTYTPLFEFSTLFDIDVGIMSLIGAKYLDSSIFNIDWFKEHTSIRELVKAVYERVDTNPLIQASKPSWDHEELKELYESFLEGDTYKEVLDRSVSTELYNLFGYFVAMGDIYPYICYSNDLELEFLKKIKALEDFKDDRFIKLDKLIMKPDDYKFIMQYYAKDCENMFMTAVSSMLSKYRDGIYRTVYLVDYNFNMQDGNTKFKLVPNILSILSRNHSIRTIGMYNRSKLEGNTNDRGIQTGENELSETESQE